MQEVVDVDKVQYTSFESLKSPQLTQISDAVIEVGFNSKQWTYQFQTVTALRQANKHCSATFLNELLPKFYKQIIAQVQNLRSNNSKEGLTLLTEVFTTQDLNELTGEIMKPLVNILFMKSVSQKGFLKSEALKAINQMTRIRNNSVSEELMNLTKSNNATISQLAIKTINQMMQKNEISQVSQSFLKDLSYNINGKRSIVQKNAKEILNGLKKRVGEQKLQGIIDKADELDPQQTNTLKRQLKKADLVQSKSNNNFKEFMKMKKNELSSTS